MLARVLGSAAGGGFPQWNCGCDTCSLARAGDPRVRPRTQDSIALRASARDAFVLVNASPDVGRQIEATPALWPRAARHTPVAAVVLTNGDLDHVLGLFAMRESQPFAVYATRAVLRGLVEGNALVRTLRRFEGHVTFRALELDRRVALLGPSGDDTGLRARAFPVAGKPPVHLVGTDAGAPSPEDNVGLELTEDSGAASVAIATACAAVDEATLAAVARSRVAFFDGTFWSSDELAGPGLSRARAEDMAHLPIGGERGSLARLAKTARPDVRRIYTHINNTNPVLVEGSPERRAVEATGWEIAEDGLEIAC